ncbi:MAG: orotidine-5'-phosphate decarboxylase [Thermodesulfovibrionales bacterium]|nr:orotidine-5'-phosphate decarboxylase [Thermodesulfovibrionales bacterium]
MLVKERIILALDTYEPEYALQLVDRFSEDIEIFKVGLELFAAGGPDIVQNIIKRGKKVFLDLKLHDIPNTVSRTAKIATRLGVFMLNMHASGGLEMMRRTRDTVVETCLKENLPRPRLIGVTLLTSLSPEAVRNELCIPHSIRTHVKHLSRLAFNAGLDGVVASGQEIETIKNHCGKNFLVVVPGIRMSWNPPDDQNRTVTPREAFRAGADYIVLGRAIMREEDPLKALRLVLLDLMATG